MDYPLSKKTIYSQKFKVEWDLIPEYKNWLTLAEINPNKAQCRYYNVIFYTKVLCKLHISSRVQVAKDLGEFLREQVKIKFSSGPLSQADSLECERQYSSLKRLADNTYAKAYPRQFSTTASGLKTEEQLKAAVSNEFFEYCEKGKPGFFSKFNTTFFK